MYSYNQIDKTLCFFKNNTKLIDELDYLYTLNDFFFSFILSLNKLKLNAGLFLAAQSSIRYKLGTVGGLKSTFLSGEHIMMVFEGPAEIYIQTRDINSFEHFILKHVNKNQPGGNINNLK